MKNLMWTISTQTWFAYLVIPNIPGMFAHKAIEFEAQIKNGIKKPFEKVIHATLGCCQGAGQKPITFFRQVLAAITCPSLLESDVFPSDVKKKATLFLKSVRGSSIGSYSPSNGIPLVRQSVARYIRERDGIETFWNNIYLTNGASDAILGLLNLLNDGTQTKKVGVLTPVPQYPLYSLGLKMFGMVNVEYYLHEDRGWSIDVNELQTKINALKPSCTVKAMVVINPGNPTGQVLTKENMMEIVKFCNINGLMIIADEVYQLDIRNEDITFFSFKKIIHDLNLVPNNVTLASVMSVSKGYIGECGIRGGYVELENMDADVQTTFEKSLYLELCPTTYGQASLYCLCNSPKPGEPSYDLFQQEKMEISNDLKLKAKMVEDAFNSMEGFSCTRIDGASYAFPKITFPSGMLKEAKERNQEPDYMYVLELLENTGVSIIAGSGFGQKPETYHLRISLLLQMELLKELIDILRGFHKKFLEKYQ